MKRDYSIYSITQLSITQITQARYW